MANLNITKNCAGCSNRISDRKFLECYKCKDTYDLLCANISEEWFYNIMSKERKQTWECPQCKSQQPKNNNTNTPVRQLMDFPETITDENTNVSYITTRAKSKPRPMDESLLSNGSPPQGNTMILDAAPSNSELILSELRALRTQVADRFNNQEFRISDLTETLKKIQTTVETEIKDLKILCTKNSKRIDELQSSNTQLRREMDEVKKIMISFKPTTQHTSAEPSYANVTLGNNDTSSSPEGTLREITSSQKTLLRSPNNIKPERDYSRYLVLYGLNEYQYENDQDLYERVINVFYDITNIDLTGYIEELQRIGRRGWRRPVVIELLSKRLAKTLLSGVNHFKNTGLWISEYLDEEGLNARKLKKDRYKKMNKRSYNTTEYPKQSIQPQPTSQHQLQHQFQPTCQLAAQPPSQPPRLPPSEPCFLPLHQPPSQTPIRPPSQLICQPPSLPPSLPPSQSPSQPLCQSFSKPPCQPPSQPYAKLNSFRD